MYFPIFIITFPKINRCHSQPALPTAQVICLQEVDETWAGRLHSHFQSHLAVDSKVMVDESWLVKAGCLFPQSYGHFIGNPGPRTHIIWPLVGINLQNNGNSEYSLVCMYSVCILYIHIYIYITYYIYSIYIYIHIYKYIFIYTYWYIYIHTIYNIYNHIYICASLLGTHGNVWCIVHNMGTWYNPIPQN